MAALFRSGTAFPERVYVESFTMEDGGVLLIEDTQGSTMAPRYIRLGDYRPMNGEACDLFDAACAALALVADGQRTTHDFITDSISSRLNGFIGGPTKMSDSGRAMMMKGMVASALADEVKAGRIADYSVTISDGGEANVKVTLSATIRQVDLDPRYQMTFEVK